MTLAIAFAGLGGFDHPARLQHVGLAAVGLRCARRLCRHRGVRLERRPDRRGGAALAAGADRRDGGRLGHPDFRGQHADANRLRGLRRDHRPLRSGLPGVRGLQPRLPAAALRHGAEDTRSPAGEPAVGGRARSGNAKSFARGTSQNNEGVMYGELGLFIDGAWKKNGSSNKGEDVINPATEKPLAPPAARQQIRSRRGAGIRQEGLRRLARDLGLRPLQDHAQGRRPDARAPRRHLQDHGAGAGQALSRGARRGDRLRRHHRLVRRGGPPLATAASCRAAARACASWWCRSRSAWSRRSRRGISRC